MAALKSQMAPHPDKKSQEIVTDETNHRATQPSRVVYSITHALPGRVGFCVPRIAEDPEFVQRLQALLAAERWVTNEQVNSVAASIVITYKSGVIPDAEMRSHLASLIQSASDLEMGQRGRGASRVRRFPPLSGLAWAEGQRSQPRAEVPSVERTGVGRGEGLSACSPAPQLPSSPALFSDETNQRARQPSKIAYSIAHAIPGRVRFRVPRIAQDPEYVKRLEALLAEDSWITSERVNSAAASIVMIYKTGVMLDSEMRSHLASLIQSASDAVAVTGSTAG